MHQDVFRNEERNNLYLRFMSTNKDQQAILKKLGIEQLNPMQLEAHKAIAEREYSFFSLKLVGLLSRFAYL